MKILICGFMGAGKTTLLNQFKENDLGFECLDLDFTIASDLNLTSLNLGAWIESHGFLAFRDLESAKLKYLLKDPQSMVIALGGGSLSSENLTLIKSERETYLVFLDTELDVCLERIKHDANRPLLKLPREEIVKLYEQRRVNFMQSHLIVGRTQLKEIVGLDSLVHNLLSIG